jgi:hypothetical protein
MVSGITFISYAHNQKVGKPNNLSVFVSKLTKEPKQDNQKDHLFLTEEKLSFINNYII